MLELFISKIVGLVAPLNCVPTLKDLFPPYKNKTVNRERRSHTRPKYLMVKTAGGGEDEGGGGLKRVTSR